MTNSSESWDIHSKVTGDTNSNEQILPMEPDPQGTLVRKYQKCGKKGCKCQRGFLHGPYWWRVFYDKETRKQRWKYIGKVSKL